jgi:hypothetical protein
MQTVAWNHDLLPSAWEAPPTWCPELALAVIVSLRAVLVYSEAATCQQPVRWRDLVPARLCLPAGAPARSAAAPRGAAVEV